MGNQKHFEAAPCSTSCRQDDWGYRINDSNSNYPNQYREENEKLCYNMKGKEECAKLKVKLNKEAATYLWDSLGNILTKSLLDIAERQPDNPLHCLAHTLLYYKYHKKSKDTTPKLSDRLVSDLEYVFKTTLTQQVHYHPKKVEDEDQEISALNSNIPRQFLFNLFEQ